MMQINYLYDPYFLDGFINEYYFLNDNVKPIDSMKLNTIDISNIVGNYFDENIIRKISKVNSYNIHSILKVYGFNFIDYYILENILNIFNINIDELKVDKIYSKHKYIVGHMKSEILYMSPKPNEICKYKIYDIKYNDAVPNYLSYDGSLFISKNYKKINITDFSYY